MSRRVARRAFLGALATMPALGGVALATTPDPIFAVLEREQELFDAWGALLELHENWDRPEIDDAREASHAQFDEMIDTVPATAAGFVALFARVLERRKDQLDECEHEIFGRVLATGRAMIGERCI